MMSFCSRAGSQYTQLLCLYLSFGNNVVLCYFPVWPMQATAEARSGTWLLGVSSCHASQSRARDFGFRASKQRSRHSVTTRGPQRHTLSFSPKRKEGTAAWVFLAWRVLCEKPRRGPRQRCPQHPNREGAEKERRGGKGGLSSPSLSISLFFSLSTCTWSSSPSARRRGPSPCARPGTRPRRCRSAPATRSAAS
jgi:hypothetical protein